MHLNGTQSPNLLSDAGQRGFQTWWWRQMESPSWQTFVRYEWEPCTPSHQSLIIMESVWLVERTGNLDVGSW